MTEISIHDKLVFNLMVDMKKKDIDPFERAEIINKYMKDHSMSQRELGRQIGVPHSTVADWCRWTKLTKPEYKSMKKRGLNNTNIYRILRENINVDKHEYVEKTKFDYEIEKFHKYIKTQLRDPELSQRTVNMIQELQNDLNRTLMYIEKNLKRIR